ncbi:hypothetical protein [Paenibacillus chitinolyticus]|uniref:hypothetical protein n=1 Tax=Paenibacillus chitinolyticus TaxID=79263 RepID=UPI003CFF87D5
MNKKILSTSLAALIVISGAATGKVVDAASEPNSADSTTILASKWRGDSSLQSPEWFKEQVKSNEESIKSLKINKQYNFIHKNGKSYSKEEISSLAKSNIDFSPDENNKKVYLVAVGYYTVNGEDQVEYFFSNIENPPINDIRKYAIEAATEKQRKTDGFTKKFSTTAEVPTGTSYADTFHYAIYSTQEKYSDGTYAVAGLLDSTIEYEKKGTTTISGKKASIWDIKANNQTKPVNGYQTRKIGSRHTVESYLSAQTLLSYGPTTTTAGSNFAVSLTGGFPSVSWNFSRQTVDAIDSSSLSGGYGKWDFDFPLGAAVAKNTYLMQPGIRVANTSGMICTQHSHYGDYYKNLSYQGYGVSGMVNSCHPDF